MVLMEFSITPMGKGESLSPYVARCVDVVEKSGLTFELHSMGTIVEGELDDVLAVMKKCFEVLAADCDRITCSAKFDYRRGHHGRIGAKVASVAQKLGWDLKKRTPAG